MDRDPDGTLRVALIGYGLGGASFHAPFLVTTPGLRLAAIVTSHPERKAQASRDHPDVRVLDAADRVWENAASLDVAVIATANRTHVPLALAALRAGLHVVVDKPFAPTAVEGRRVIEEAARCRRMVTVYHNRRWDGDILTLRQLLRDGALGEPFRFESRFERWRPDPKPGWKESADPRDAGGILFDLGSHLIDQALHLFGPATLVHAELERRRRGVEVDDDAFLALRHENGVLSHLYAGALVGQPGPRMRVLGTTASYVKHGVDVQEDALRVGKRPGGRDWGVESAERWGLLGAGDDVRRVPTLHGSYGEFYAGVVRAIREGAPPPVDPGDAVAGLEIIEAARRTAARA